MGAELGHEAPKSPCGPHPVGPAGQLGLVESWVSQKCLWRPVDGFGGGPTSRRWVDRAPGRSTQRPCFLEMWVLDLDPSFLTLAPLILWARYFFAVGSCHMHCWVLNSIPSLEHAPV